MQKNTNKIIKFILFLSPILVILLFALLKITRPIIYAHLNQEDAPLEVMQTVTYFLASVGALITSVRFLRQRKTWHGVLYAVLALGLIMASLEEISWGQRVFGLKTPAYFKAHNRQREISFHNLLPIQNHLCRAYALVGLYGSFAWLILGRVKTRPDHLLRFVAPDWFISSYFYATLFVYSYFQWISRFGVHVLGVKDFRIGAWITWRDQEPAEWLLSLGFLLFVIVNEIKSRKLSRSDLPAQSGRG